MFGAGTAASARRENSAFDPMVCCTGVVRPRVSQPSLQATFSGVPSTAYSPQHAPPHSLCFSITALEVLLTPRQLPDIWRQTIRSRNQLRTEYGNNDSRRIGTPPLSAVE